MTHAPLMLSVSGVRGIVGQSMTADVARGYSGAFASYLRDKLGRTPVICLARDSRPSGKELQQAASEALVGGGCSVTDLGIVATPTAGVMIHSLQADGGMVVTASHNPTPWNGLKCLDGDGLAPSKDDAQEIIRRFQNGVSLDAMDGGQCTENFHGDDTHISKVLGIIDPTPIQHAQYRVVLDSINGAGCASGLKLLELLGCQVLHLNGEPSGEFAHTPEPKAENLKDLCEAVGRYDADVGFAQDPDADRLAIVDENGRYIGEEYTLVLAALQWLGTHPNASTATNLSTSRMIDDIAALTNCSVHRSAVGEANVVNTMKEHSCIIGGEGNGGVIFPEVCWVRDSLIAMAMTLDLMQDRGNLLSAIVNNIPRYEMIKRTIDLVDLGGLPILEKEIDRLRRKYAAEEIDESDGLRIDFEEGWLHVRPSNTEPIARVIAEAKDSLTAYTIANRVQLGECGSNHS